MNKNVVGNKDVGRADTAEQIKSKKEKELEQGLEESMAYSDPINVTQPLKPSTPK